MTRLLCLEDSYLKECTSKVIEVMSNDVVLDQTVFYPAGGGVPGDTGMLEHQGEEIKVINVRKESGEVLLTLENNPLAWGNQVVCKIDWDSRYKIMRMHTSAHIIGATMFKRGVLITGNQIGFEQTRMDFNCDTGLEGSMFNDVIAEVNELLKKSVELKIYSLPKEEAFKIEGLVKLAGKLPPDVEVMRIVEIPGIDLQADGGPHVKNINEIGIVKIERIENKGSKNKRLYYSLTG